jgi:hypothetical protein
MLNWETMRTGIYLRILRWKIKDRALSKFWKIIILSVFPATALGFVIWHFKLWEHWHQFPQIDAWLDIVLGTFLLAIVPFAMAAYGGHVAAESIEDLKRRRSVKLKFWVICVVGIVLAFIQQYRYITQDSASKLKTGKVEDAVLGQLRKLHEEGPTLTPEQTETKRRGEIESMLRGQFILSHDPIDPDILLGNKMPPDGWMNERLRQMHEQWSVAKPPDMTKPIIIPKPDVTAKFVYPQEIALELTNHSQTVVKDPTVLLLLFDLDGPGDQPSPLQIPLALGPNEYIKSGSYIVPLTVTGNSSLKNTIRKGDRILGWVSVTCLDCVSTNSYWVYAVHGSGGWYSPCEKGKHPQLNAISKNWHNFVKYGDAYLSGTVPIERRIPIDDTIP